MLQKLGLQIVAELGQHPTQLTDMASKCRSTSRARAAFKDTFTEDHGYSLRDRRAEKDAKKMLESGFTRRKSTLLAPSTSLEI